MKAIVFYQSLTRTVYYNDRL